MPQHFSHKDLHVVTQGSSTGTQFLQAVGAAFGMQRDNNKGVVYVSSGEGTTSQGDFHEALNWASKDKAPVIFHIEDNNYAISVPKIEQTSGQSVYNISQGYDSLMRYDIDGTDFFESHLTFKKAIERARLSRGPSVIVSNVVRLLPHSNADDHRKYRSDVDIENDKKRDPIVLFAKKCIDSGIIKEEEFEIKWAELQAMVGLMKTDYSLDDLSYEKLPPGMGGYDGRQLWKEPDGGDSY